MTLREACSFSFWMGVRHDEIGRRCYTRRSLALLAWRIRHRLTGPQRGCSCTRCFHHPRRRVPAREIYEGRVRFAALERRVRELEKAQR